MRLKHVWGYVPLPAYAKLFWERVTFSRLTVIYLAFSIFHFLIQLALQTRAFTINAAAFKSGFLLVQQGNADDKGLPFYTNSTLRICRWVPSNLNLDNDHCSVVWPEPQGNTPSQQDNLPSSPADYGIYSSSTVVRLQETTVNGLSSTVIHSLPTPEVDTSFTVLATLVIPATSLSLPIVTPSTPSLARNTQTLPPSITSPSPVPPVIRPTPTPVNPRPQVDNTPSSSSDQVLTATVVAATPPTPAPATPTVTVVTVINNANGGPADDDDKGEESDDDKGEGSDDDGSEENDDDEGEESDDDEGEESDDESDGDDDDDDDETDSFHTLSRRDYPSINAVVEEIGISPVCLRALNYPLSILANTKREDIVFMAFQFWVLGMSVVALLNESIPHIFASLFTHVIATAWGSLQLVHTANFRKDFSTLITNGACRGMPHLPITAGYWEARRAAEISSLTLNVAALLVSCFLSWKLFKLFGWQTFKRVGASFHINRMYKLVLTLSITIQLSLFFMAVTVSLWLDRLINNNIGDLADLRKVYMASSIVTLILLIPWLMMGWFGVRRELRIPMLIFLGLCVLYLGGWSVMFISTTFRWTFITWGFFSIIAVASVLLTVSCLIFGILCRMNFGKGLLRYLTEQDTLPGEFGIVTPEYGYDDEKVEFPSTEKPMPTFNATYGNEFPGRGLVFMSNGPKFHNQSTQLGTAVVLPPQALTRTPSDGSTCSSSSEKSSSSWASYYNYSHSPSNSVQHGHPKRWVIE